LVIEASFITLGLQIFGEKRKQQKTWWQKEKITKGPLAQKEQK